jgi:regulatory protein
MSEARAKRGRRPPRRITPERLNNIALHYLGRYASSSANLGRVLMRRVARSAKVHGDDPTEGARMVAELVERFRRSGLIDDRTYAVQKAATLRRRGASRFGIGGRLRQKGVEPDLIADALGALDESAPGGEFAAACAFIRRRRLGPCRTPGKRRAMRDKDLAALSRAGFALDLARRALACPDPVTLDAWARGEGGK